MFLFKTAKVAAFFVIHKYLPWFESVASSYNSLLFYSMATHSMATAEPGAEEYRQRHKEQSPAVLTYLPPANSVQGCSVPQRRQQKIEEGRLLRS